MKLKVGMKAPDFTLPSQLDKKIRLKSLLGKGPVALAFFPLAWTPVWTNQIPSYEADLAKFEELNAQVLGISIDHVPCLKAWAESLNGISFPLLSDFSPFAKVSKKYGIKRKEGYSERAIFVINEDGIITYIDIHNIADKPKNRILFGELKKITGKKATKTKSGTWVLYPDTWPSAQRGPRNIAPLFRMRMCLPVLSI
jgi:peroxiredoxin